MSKAQEAEQFLNDLETIAPAPRLSAGAGSSKSSKAAGGAAKPGEAAEALAFLDEITQKSAEPTPRTSGLLERPSSRAGTPSSLRKSTGERVRMTASPLLPSASMSPAPSPARMVGPSAAGSSLPPAASSDQTEEKQPAPESKGWGGWGGFGSVLGAASAAVQQVRTVAEEQVKNAAQSEQAKKWSGGAMAYVQSAQQSAQGYVKNAQEYAKNAQLDKLGNHYYAFSTEVL
jgi:flagellar hook-basal body complex protein FliE